VRFEPELGLGSGLANPNPPTLTLALTLALALALTLTLALLQAALLLGVEVKVGQTVGSLDQLAGYDVLLLATGFQRKLLKTFGEEAEVLGELDGAGFQEAPVPDKLSV